MGAAEELSKALHLHPNVHVFVNDGYPYAWVKEHPVKQRKYLLVEREPRHFYREHQSLGVDTDLWRRATELGIEWVIMVYEGARGKIVYRSSLSDWRSFGAVVVHKGFKDQKQLPVKCMKVLERDAEHNTPDQLA